MSSSAQIRLLLGVVCATFFITAFIVKQTFTPKVNLEQTGTILQSNLQAKETYVNKLINDKHRFEKLKYLTDNPAAAINLIQDFTTDNRIWVYTYVNNKVKFWSGIKVMPDDPSKFNEGVQCRNLVNGYYQIIKKTQGNFTTLFIIPIKNIYPLKNRYLKTTFDIGVLQDNHIDIADFDDKPAYSIHALNGAYLFAIKLVPGAINHRFYYFQLALWLLGFITLCTLVHKSCTYLSIKGYTLISIGLLATFICLAGIAYLKFNLPDLSDLDLFKHKLYSSGVLFPSFGHFCMTILAAFWLGCFIYYNRYRLIIKARVSKAKAYLIIAAFSVFLIILAGLLLMLFYGLVVHSQINFDVTNVFNLSRYSVLGVLMLCFSFQLFYLLNDTVLNIVRPLTIPDKHKLFIFSGFILAATIITIIKQDFSLFYIIGGLFTVIRAYILWYDTGKLKIVSFLVLIVLCALISAIKLNYFQQIKDKRLRRELIHQLETADDKIADSAFSRIENKIISDQSSIDYFTKQQEHNDAFLKDYLQKTYFDGYLNKYDLKMYAFNSAGDPVTNEKNYLLNDFKDLVTYSSISVSRFFYHDSKFGFQSYFAILPISKKDNQLGTIVISLSSKPFNTNITFPELLVNGEVKTDDRFNNYSYAYYVDGKLESQSGKYPYKLVSTDFSGQFKNYTTEITKSINSAWYKPFARDNHLVYQPDKRSMIVVSCEEDPAIQVITSVSFFFLAFLMFSAMVAFVTWLWLRVRIFSIQNKRIKWGFKINLDNIAYRTRIQFYVMLTVVLTLLLIGAITFKSISLQYDEQQDEMIRNKLNGIASIFKEGLEKEQYSTTPAGMVKFNEFAKTYQADLTLFNTYGIPLLTTQRKIYDYNLLARRMNGRAFIAMDMQHQTMLLNTEKFGDYTYKAAYVPIKTDKNKAEAYLQLPYFDNVSDNNSRSGALFNAMINIYAVICIGVGLFAVLIARQITGPLQFIQQSISKTIYGQKNEPILWNRDDEIGALVKEYNKMIGELEISAKRLAQTEREMAWREMAKQVAHEIKNPLTPLKLGLQLLDKAWKDNDPKFNQKFERFSKSFVEQIDSLSSIASEFSAFAKMPDTKMEKVNLFDVINQAVTIFKQMDNITINYKINEPFFINADKDQLMRCFNNLLKNAIEAIPVGKHGLISITHKMEDGRVLILLTDNGNGIPDNLRQKIFVPNFTTKSSGTGLGLAFVKNSVENSGGKIWFETEIGKGTSFFINWPAAV